MRHQGHRRSGTDQCYSFGRLGPRTSGLGQGHMCSDLWAVPGPCPPTVRSKMSLILPSPPCLLPLHSPEGRGRNHRKLGPEKVRCLCPSSQWGMNLDRNASTHLPAGPLPSSCSAFPYVGPSTKDPSWPSSLMVFSAAEEMEGPAQPRVCPRGPSNAVVRGLGFSCSFYLCIHSSKGARSSQLSSASRGKRLSVTGVWLAKGEGDGDSE